jgi:hypothetical protein
MEIRNIIDQMLRLPVEFLTGFALVYLQYPTYCQRSDSSLDGKFYYESFVLYKQNTFRTLFNYSVKANHLSA